MAGVGLTHGGLGAFAERLVADATTATSGDGGRTAFSVAGRAVEVAFSSRALRHALEPAWSGLPDGRAGTRPARILVLDRETAGDPPPPPWPADAYRPRDEIAGYGDEAVEVGYELTSGTLMLWHAGSRTGVWWTRAADAIPVWERAMPMRALLRWALRDEGVALVHGAAVGTPDGVALLVGAGGSGKSTLALAARLAGWTYLADDYCAVDPEAGVVAPVTCYAKATDGTLALLPDAAAWRSSLPLSPDGKHVLSAPPSAASASLALVALPRVHAAAEPASAAPAAATMAALAPTSLLQMPGSRDADRDLLGQVVRSVRAVHLPSGPDLAVTLDGLRRELGVTR